MNIMLFFMLSNIWIIKLNSVIEQICEILCKNVNVFVYVDVLE